MKDGSRFSHNTGDAFTDPASTVGTKTYSTKDIAEGALNRMRTTKKSDLNGALEATRQNVLKAEQGLTPEFQSQAKQMEAFAKGNKYRRRLLEDVLVEAKRDGYEKVAVPKPSTVARIEWNKGSLEDAVPYNRADNTPFNITEEVSVGDNVTYLDDDYVVVSTKDGVQIAPSDKVRSFSAFDYIEDQVQFGVDDFRSQYPELLAKEGNLKKKDLTDLKGDHDWLYDDMEFKLRDEGKVTAEDIEEAFQSREYESVGDFMADDLQGTYGDNVFIEEKGGGAGQGTYEEITVVDEDTVVESFGQPNEYESGGLAELQEMFAADTDKKLAKKMYSEYEWGVIDNYFDARANLAKMEKDYNIKVEDHDLDGVKFWLVHLNKNIKRSAF
jgi:hypothetical protein